MRDTSPRPPALPRIFDHARYASAARADHEAREREAKETFRVCRARDWGQIIGNAMIASAFTIGIATAASLFWLR